LLTPVSSECGSLGALAKNTARFCQPAPVTTVREGVVIEILSRKGFAYFWHTIPHRLSLFQVWARFHRAFGTCGEAFGLTTAACLTRAAGMKQLLVGSQAPATRDILGPFVQTVDPLPCIRGALLVCNSLSLASEGRAIRAEHSASGHHFGHLCCLGQRAALDITTPAKLILPRPYSMQCPESLRFLFLWLSLASRTVFTATLCYRLHNNVSFLRLRLHGLTFS